METVRQVIDDDPVTPSRPWSPGLPALEPGDDLPQVHSTKIRLNDTNRPEALADDLDRAISRGEPIRAKRTAIWEREAKWATTPSGCRDAHGRLPRRLSWVAFSVPWGNPAAVKPGGTPKVSKRAMRSALWG